MAQLDREIIELFCPIPELERGLGIIETGYIAGSLSGLCLVGFELLGKISVQAESDAAVIALACSSRLLGELGQDLVGYIPSIPPLEQVDVASLSGRLHEFSADKVIDELGQSKTIALVAEQLIPLIGDCCSYYLGRCGDVADKAFSRILERLRSSLVEVEMLMGSVAIESGTCGKPSQKYSDILVAINLK